MPSPDDIMRRKRTETNPLFPEPRVPDGALEPGKRKLPVLPYMKFGKRVYGKHTAVEIGIKGEF